MENPYPENDLMSLSYQNNQKLDSSFIRLGANVWT